MSKTWSLSLSSNNPFIKSYRYHKAGSTINELFSKIANFSNLMLLTHRIVNYHYENIFGISKKKKLAYKIHRQTNSVVGIKFLVWMYSVSQEDIIES